MDVLTFEIAISSHKTADFGRKMSDFLGGKGYTQHEKSRIVQNRQNQTRF
jgi:hypothetical protein